MALTSLAVVLAILAVGGVDLATGADIHVVSLYFVPLALAGWRLGRVGAAAASLLATGVWLAALYIERSRDLALHIWVVNFVTQALAFLTVSMLVAVLCERLTHEKTLRRTDPLTGLANRQAFFEQAAIALSLCQRNARPVSLAYLDLDNFKNANDRFGHAFGDTLLRRCGELIAASVRGSDIAARIGGDEFVVLLPETPHDEATRVMARFVAAIDAIDDFRSASVTASIGVVVDARAGAGVAELVALADAQMYLAKQRGKNGLQAAAVAG
jgi:diguanylate cyclase (GGDEF)-like protein